MKSTSEIAWKYYIYEMHCSSRLPSTFAYGIHWSSSSAFLPSPAGLSSRINPCWTDKTKKSYSLPLERMKLAMTMALFSVCLGLRTGPNASNDLILSQLLFAILIASKILYLQYSILSSRISQKSLIKRIHNQLHIWVTSMGCWL